MKEIARELAELWPTRFEFTAVDGSILWTCWDRVRGARLHDGGDVVFWAFWGPLAEEMGVRDIRTDYACPDGHTQGCPGQCHCGKETERPPILEALASAVVARVREVRR